MWHGLVPARRDGITARPALRPVRCSTDVVYRDEVGNAAKDGPALLALSLPVVSLSNQSK